MTLICLFPPQKGETNVKHRAKNEVWFSYERLHYFLFFIYFISGGNTIYLIQRNIKERAVRLSCTATYIKMNDATRKWKEQLFFNQCLQHFLGRDFIPAYHYLARTYSLYNWTAFTCRMYKDEWRHGRINRISTF